MKQNLSAFTLVETVISLALVAIIFVLVMQAFNSLILGSYLIDARTAVRNEGEFVSEYLKLRIKNADPKTLEVRQTPTGSELTWQTRGATDVFTVFVQEDPARANYYRLCIDNTASIGTITCDTVLTYQDVNIKNFKTNANIYTDPATGQIFSSVDISFSMDSTAKLGSRAAVVDVSRYFTIAIR